VLSTVYARLFHVAPCRAVHWRHTYT
jgi:hypothetical protein